MDVVFYRDAQGREAVIDYLLALERQGDTASRAAFERAVDRLIQEGMAIRMPHARIIDRQERLFELRFRDHRVAFVEDQGRAILLHAWRKRRQRLDTREAATALRAAEEWRWRGRGRTVT